MGESTVGADRPTRRIQHLNARPCVVWDLAGLLGWPGCPLLSERSSSPTARRTLAELLLLLVAEWGLQTHIQEAQFSPHRGCS